MDRPFRAGPPPDETRYAMHATKLITPEVLLVMCIGGIVFILIMKAIFRKPK